MSRNFLESMPRLYAPPIITLSPSLSLDANTTPQNPTLLFTVPKVLPAATPTNPGRPALACPVRSCPLVFDGKTPHGYLWRHLRRPGIYKRSGEERDAWLHLHKIEYDRLVATGMTPVQRRREANRARAQKAREQKVLKVSRVELHAGNGGIREKKLAAQKVAIREGMHAAKQRGDSIGHDAWALLDFCTSL